MHEIFLILGIFVLILTFYDFFHTTLSSNGFGIFSGAINLWASKLILNTNSKSIYHYSGFVHLLLTSFLWLFFLLLGTFMIFISGEEMVVNASTKLPANFIERFYYSCYLIATLGIGDYIPGNNLSRILSAILSFSGFILLTTAMTYLISVINSVLHKKELAFYIFTFGCNIEEIYKFATINSDVSALPSRSSDLTKMIIKNSSNFISFPIIHYFLSRKRSGAAILQLSILYEILVVLQEDYSPDDYRKAKMNSILTAIEFYLELGLNRRNNFHFDAEKLAKMRKFWNKYGLTYNGDPEKDETLNAALLGAGWSWEDVYKLETKK